MKNFIIYHAFIDAKSFSQHTSNRAFILINLHCVCISLHLMVYSATCNVLEQVFRCFAGTLPLFTEKNDNATFFLFPLLATKKQDSVDAALQMRQNWCLLLKHGPPHQTLTHTKANQTVCSLFSLFPMKSCLRDVWVTSSIFTWNSELYRGNCRSESDVRSGTMWLFIRNPALHWHFRFMPTLGKT